MGPLARAREHTVLPDYKPGFKLRTQKRALATCAQRRLAEKARQGLALWRMGKRKCKISPKGHQKTRLGRWGRCDDATYAKASPTEGALIAYCREWRPRNRREAYILQLCAMAICNAVT